MIARRKGWSLVEISVATAVSSIVMGITLQVTSQTGDAVGEGLERSSLSVRASRCGRLLAGELRSVQGSSVSLSNAALSSGEFTSVSFQQVSGFDTQASSTLVGPVTELRFVLDPGEAWNVVAADDDGDGLIDEGRLVLFRDANANGGIEADEELATLARGVAGSSLSFSLPSGSQTPADSDVRLDVTFELHDRLASGAVVAQRRNLRVALRN